MLRWISITRSGVNRWAEPSICESAAVGQDRTVPRAEAVQAARLFEDIRSRTQVKVVGIPQNNLRPDLLLQVTVEHPFDAAHRPHRHKDRCPDFTVVGREHPGACGAAGVGM